MRKKTESLTIFTAAKGILILQFKESRKQTEYNLPVPEEKSENTFEVDITFELSSWTTVVHDLIVCQSDIPCATE